MIFLFEEHPYDFKFLKEAIGHSEGDLKYRSKSGFNTETTKDGVKINGVGYCFFNGQPVFVLPKVFLDENGQKAFGENINPKGEDCFGNQKEEDQSNRGVQRKIFSSNSPQRKFFSSISLWLYSAIDKYNKNSEGTKDNGVATPPQSESRNFKKNDRYATLLDIMSSMELFYKKNQSLFVFVAKNKHSGNHKINWQRTVNKKTPFIQSGVPIYMDLVKKAKVFDLDDRLLVLYFSAMRFIQDKFGYTMPQSEFYQPLKMNEMERLLENERGLRELKKIKYKYFEDRLLKLYNIMEAFFRWGACYKNKNNNVQEYLIANSFNNVFEAMIDELIGDPEAAKLKKNSDGKIIDHLYKEKSLIFASENSEQIWHIGDSKYYQDPNDIKGQSIAKQFTYAKNVMQDFFSPEYVDNENNNVNDENNFYDSPEKNHHGIRYRDKLTEGYSVTPNFFIRGDLPEYNDNPSQYEDDYFCATDDERNNLIAEVKDSDEFYDDDEKCNKNIKKQLWKNRNRHFKNRLFDRDTLLLQVYNVNFLYVLKAYTSKYSGFREEFKTNARKMFRDNFLKLLDEKYVFWAVWPKKDSFADAHNYKEAEELFVNKHFRTLAGKIFKPHDVQCLILALERDSSNPADSSRCYNEDLFSKINQDCEYFHITPNDIFPINIANLPEATFTDNEIEAFNEWFFAYPVKRDVLELKRIGKTHKLPRTINGRKLTGAILGDCDIERIGIQKSPLDEYYYLPCKE